MKHFVVGITGASGSIYGLRLIEELLKNGQRSEEIVVGQVLAYETGLQLAQDPADGLRQLRRHFAAAEELQHYADNDFFAPLASGSSAADAVIICPCSMGTAGRIAAGLSDSLLERVADVALKEQKQLLLVPRETPFNRIHLENLLRLCKAGAQILPAMPAFYQQPQTVAELVDFVVGKTLDNLGIAHQLFQRWGDDA
jgi:4-hydroxy-3-polyprenylbenzoate decarboxylase